MIKPIYLILFLQSAQRSYFYLVRLQNGEKQTGLQWSSWFETVPESPSANIRSSIASYLSVFSYSGEEVIKSRSIPPSPSPGRSFSTIPRSKSDEANIGTFISFI